LYKTKSTHSTSAAAPVKFLLGKCAVIEGLLEERKLMQNLLQQMMNLNLTADSRVRVGSPPKIIFMHPATG
jgi:hypothetical protein